MAATANLRVTRSAAKEAEASVSSVAAFSGGSQPLTLPPGKGRRGYHSFVELTTDDEIKKARKLKRVSPLLPLPSSTLLARVYPLPLQRDSDPGSLPTTEEYIKHMLQSAGRGGCSTNSNRTYAVPEACPDHPWDGNTERLRMAIIIRRWEPVTLVHRADADLRDQVPSVAEVTAVAQAAGVLDYAGRPIEGGIGMLLSSIFGSDSFHSIPIKRNGVRTRYYAFACVPI